MIKSQITNTPIMTTLKKVNTAFLSLLLFVPALLLLNTGVKAEITFPNPTGYVNDYENLIDNDQELELKLSSFKEETGIEFTIVTVSDFGGTYLEDYANKLFNNWGIGEAQEDNGLLLLVSSNQRESRIEIGYGLEGRLTDAKSGRIQDEYMIPYFKDSDYSGGINKCADALI